MAVAAPDSSRKHERSCCLRTMQVAADGWCTLDALVIMPNHVRVLWTPQVPLSALLRKVIGPTAPRTNQLSGADGPFCQDEYFDPMTTQQTGPGVHTRQLLPDNQIPAEYLSFGNQLLASVPNPFFGIIPASQPLGRAVIQAGQLLRPYPQFTNVTTVGSSSGSSIYHSVQVRVEKRLSHGLSLLGSFTGGKLIDDANPGRFLSSKTTFQDRNNRRLDRSLSAQEVARQLTISYVYELPFGRGRALLASSPGVIRTLIGGWQINGIHSLQTGVPLGLTTGSNPTLGAVGAGALRPDNNGTSAKKTGPAVERLGEYFDTSVFSQPAPFRFGNTARTLPDVRSPGTVNFDLSLIKNTRIRESMNLQLRFEAFNVFNNTNFFEPNTVFGSQSFGVISNAGPARIMQMGAKFYF